MAEKLDYRPRDGTDRRTFPPTDWTRINWRKAEREVRRLRSRIFQAAQRQEWKKVKSLTKLMLRSYSNLLVSVRRVTQINEGRKTPGIDGEIAITPEQRGKLVDELRGYQPWRASPTRRVYIPKKKGMRALGIPTLRDRVMQAVVKNALEPRFEAEFEAQSYGFRPGRCCQDAIEEVFIALNEGAGGRNQYLLDADIWGAFDHLNHEFILNRIGPMPGRGLVKQWLKAGYVEYGTLHQTTEGTPQGGVISPLLMNVALDGLARHLGKGYRVSRYADDFVVMAKGLQDIEQALPKVIAFLEERGVELNQEKTHIRHRSEGFDFLGFHIRMRKKKLLITPQKEKVQNLLRRIKTLLDKHKAASAEAIIRLLNPILLGWAMYYRHVLSKGTFQKVDYQVWRMLWRWAKRRHPNKGRKWIFDRYFEKGRYGATFYADAKDGRGKKIRLRLFRMPTLPIIRHVKVKGTASPDDPSLREYWETRQTKMGRLRVARGSKLYQLAECQRWRCLDCGNPLFDGQPVDIHHVIPVEEGGTDAVENLVWLHEGCHYQRHRQRVASHLARAG